ncbi:hypothetical protein [Nocardioides ultimimeridianus]
MPDVRLIGSVPDAPWLPTGSTAEAWAGADCAVPDAVIIVRLLLSRQGAAGPELFTVRTERGPDLPTERLAAGEPVSWEEALADLARRTHGAGGVEHRCIGYIRNVVPAPDAAYPHPVPWAHVPVFEPSGPVEPVCDGTWVGLAASRPDLAVRHWWPVVERHLAG